MKRILPLVLSVSCNAVIFVYSIGHTCSLDEAKDENTLKKKASVKMHRKSFSRALMLNVVTHTEAQQQLNVCISSELCKINSTIYFEK
jgi:hypothetical protein